METLSDYEYKGVHTVETLDNGLLHVSKEYNLQIGGRTFKYLEEYDGGDTFTKKVLDTNGNVLGEGTYELPPYADAHHYYGYDKDGRRFKDGVYTGEIDKHKDWGVGVYYHTNGMDLMSGKYVSGDVINFDFRDVSIAKLNKKGLIKEFIHINGDETRADRPLDEREIYIYKFDEKSKKQSVYWGGTKFCDYSLFREETYTPDGTLRKISATQHAWEKDIRIGMEELYDDKGHLQSTISYKDNKKDEATFYNPEDGSVKEKVNCADDFNALLRVLAKTDNAREAFDLISKKCKTPLPSLDESESYDSYGKIIGNFYRNKLLGKDVKHVRDNLFVIGAVLEDRTRGLIGATGGRKCIGKLVDIEKGEVLDEVNFGYGKIKTRDFINMEDGKVYIDYQPERKQFMIPEDKAVAKARVEKKVSKKNPVDTQEPTKTAGKSARKPIVYE